MVRLLRKLSVLSIKMAFALRGVTAQTQVWISSLIVHLRLVSVAYHDAHEKRLYFPTHTRRSGATPVLAL